MRNIPQLNLRTVTSFQLTSATIHEGPAEISQIIFRAQQVYIHGGAPFSSPLHRFSSPAPLAPFGSGRLRVRSPLRAHLFSRPAMGSTYLLHRSPEFWRVHIKFRFKIKFSENFWFRTRSVNIWFLARIIFWIVSRKDFCPESVFTMHSKNVWWWLRSMQKQWNGFLLTIDFFCMEWWLPKKVIVMIALFTVLFLKNISHITNLSEINFFFRFLSQFVSARKWRIFLILNYA